jgi:hypothetical protein
MVSKTEKEFVYKNSIYFPHLMHPQECRNELSQFVKPPSDTLPPTLVISTFFT